MAAARALWPTRRRVILGAGLALGGGLLGLRLGRAAAPAGHEIVAAERSFALRGDAPAIPGWGYGEAFPPPILRVNRGEPLRARLVNRLPEHTTIHWHGIRLPNLMDGVPYLTQPPVEPGQSFVYDFRAPDAGTFWYHPHCNTLEQMGHGLTGVIVVENPNEGNDTVFSTAHYRLSANVENLVLQGSSGALSQAGKPDVFVGQPFQADPGKLTC